MMMIKGTVTAGTNVLANHLFPADRCTWLQVDDITGGYSVSDVRFYPGANANLASPGSTTGGQTVFTVTAATLGFIGKSGRFAAITN